MNNRGGSTHLLQHKPTIYRWKKEERNDGQKKKTSKKRKEKVYRKPPL